uniref:Uncharacterized protein n=1 Tax=Ditylenchus dipsaci TaxID=166011 RepID=A0A915CMZ2_9BILA
MEMDLKLTSIKHNLMLKHKNLFKKSSCDDATEEEDIEENANEHGRDYQSDGEALLLETEEVNVEMEIAATPPANVEESDEEAIDVEEES